MYGQILIDSQTIKPNEWRKLDKINSKCSFRVIIQSDRLLKGD